MPLPDTVQTIEFRSGYQPFFCSKDDNFLAVSALTSLAEHDAVILCGPSGVGKSHLLRGMLTDFAMQHQTTLEIVHAEELTELLVATLREAASESACRDRVLELFSNTALLAIDDAFTLREKTSTQHMLFSILQQFTARGGKAVLVLEEPGDICPELRDRLLRAKSCAFAEMRRPAADVRSAYAEYCAGQLALPCDAETLQKIAAEAEIIPQIRSALLAMQLSIKS